MKNLFEEYLNDPYYKELLEKLPENERNEVVKAIKEIVDHFEKNLLIPLRKYSGE